MIGKALEIYRDKDLVVIAFDNLTERLKLRLVPFLRCRCRK